jgi:hypothetical protein
LLISGLLLTLALASYCAVLHYSPRLVAFVVQESIMQKAPEHADPNLVRARFQALLDAAPDDDTRMQTVLAMSQQLEKVQKLNDLELEQLLGKGTGFPPTR